MLGRDEVRGGLDAHMKPPVSLIINTLNEEANIGDCIRSAQDLADEIIVCDMHSTDRTVEIARTFNARILFHEPVGWVEPARYFAISQASHEWVLALDADERMTPKLARRLTELAGDAAVDVVQFGMLYNYFGGYVRYGNFYDTRYARFFRKSVYLANYRVREAMVHENFRTLQNVGRRLQLPPDYYVLHEAYPTIEKYIHKTLGVYGRLEAEQRVAQGERFVPWRMLWEPTRQFLTRFIVRQGFRDGRRGFILAALYAAFRFTVWANIWFLTQVQPTTGGGESTETQ